MRFAHRDAQEVANVLTTVGGFHSNEIFVLLDPSPKRVLSVVDAALDHLADDDAPSMLVFYYSGHADERSLFPSGRPLPFADLRKRLERAAVGVRIGIIDSCRGGGWTGTRGLQSSEPFEVQMPFDLSSEGSVLIASSSGLENAHESEALRGGFFTHHWNAALRGAGDVNGDGSITLTEAYEYAKQRTIRDTAMLASTPQHPSFRMNLRGRRDLALARVSADATVLNILQDRGPIQLVHLDTGLVVLELPQGKRSVGLAVAPGRYLLRTKSGDETRAQQIDVAADETTVVREGDLRLVGRDGIVVRNLEPRPSVLSTVPDGRWDLRHSIGRRYGDATDLGFSLGDRADLTLDLSLVHGFGDRWSLNVLSPALAYRGGRRGGTEWVVTAGLAGWGVGVSSVDGALFSGTLRASFDARWWLNPRSSVQTGISFASTFRWSGNEVGNPNTGPDSWRARIGLGYTYTLANAVTLGIGIGYAQNLVRDGEFVRFSHENARASVLTFGSVQSLGFRQRPLIQVHLTDSWALDAFVGVSYDIASREFEEAYAAGFTSVF